VPGDMAMCPAIEKSNQQRRLIEGSAEERGLQPSTRVISFQRNDEVARAGKHGDVSSRRIVGVESRGR
jgi:hypothetical protein